MKPYVMKFKVLAIVMFLSTFSLYSQMGGATIDEILIHPRNMYGEVFTEFKLKSDSSYMIEVYTLSDSLLVSKGGVSSRKPLILDGRFTFYTPLGKPYATGYYKENIPIRAWNFFDENGKVINTIDYSSTHKYLVEHSGIDLGGDFVYLAEVPPTSENGDIYDFISSLAENAEYPPMSMVFGQQDGIIAQLTIDKQGQLINLEIVRGGTLEFNMEIFRLLALSPLWKPAMYNGKPQNYVLTIPFRFSFSPDHMPDKLH